ncbi:hypothetical protein GCG54_00002413 [Colletotrichum gloeosporioides]|uniref:Uncharacterized protein n=1 Tax=Colletotrichum gloeosporioides TaxID=474922 RepID=A0A8H4CAK7_COLGL|nr:uncharacterized protein GCG54_00002413 [Colletotrichum gloeosporioides]KAF3800380.1 hypothetical protein GCG54_00002413 [Colletotrichum gloeosporioides]
MFSKSLLCTRRMLTRPRRSLRSTCANFNPTSSNLLKRHKVMKYSSDVCLSNVCGALAAMVERLRPGWAVINSHAFLTYWVRDMSLTSDPEYHEIGRNSEKGRIDSIRLTSHRT